MKTLIISVITLIPAILFAEPQKALEQSSHAAKTLLFASYPQILVAVAIVLVLSTIYFIVGRRLSSRA